MRDGEDCAHLSEFTQGDDLNFLPGLFVFAGASHYLIIYDNTPSLVSGLVYVLG